MSVIKKLMQGLEKKYKTATVVAPLTIMGEVLLEVLIPLIMARIIDVGIANSDVGYVVKVGGIMVGAALLSLAFGCIAARFAAVAAFGFSVVKNKPESAYFLESSDIIYRFWASVIPEFSILTSKVMLRALLW